MLFSIAYALWQGGGPERLTAVSFAIGVAASATLGLFTMPGQFADVPIRLVVIDGVYAAFCIGAALVANRIWTIPFAACQLVAFLVHLARLAAPEMIPTSYAFLTVLWSWPMLALLIGGTVVHQMRLKRGSTMPDWKPISGRRASSGRAKRPMRFFKGFS